MKNKKIFINLILVSLVVGVILCIIIKKNEDNNINESVYESKVISSEQTEDINQNINDVEEKQYPKEEILENYNGYDVCAKLEIPVISLETYVLANYSTNALQVSVTKFWGVEPNHIGNFCIAGHNFKNKNMFSKLKNLEVGDTLYVTDKKVGKVEYEIFQVYKVLPDDVSCLDPLTNNEKEVTLITCTNDSSKRIIVKAKEINY